MSYQWEHHLESGYPKIDTQHKMLVKKLNDLGEACRAGKGKEELERALDFLAAYSIKHFEDEERLQVEHGYPDFPAHKRTHEDFKLVVQGLAEQLHREGPTEHLLHSVYVTIGDWLIHHIKGEDFKLAAYLQLQSSRQAAAADAAQ